MRRTPHRRAADAPPDPARRALLQAAGAGAAALVLGIPLALPRTADASDPALPVGSTDPKLFLRIAADDTVTILSKHFEMGQGIVTGLATLIAEELDADWSQMRFAFAPHAPEHYNNLAWGNFMGTGGTNSIFNSWRQMRTVGAAARAMLVSAAAARWQVPDAEVTVAGGVVHHRPSQRTTRFGALAAEAMRLPVPAAPRLKEPSEWKLIGRSLPRLDQAEKIAATARFASDLRRPGELVAMVRRPPRFGATVASFDARYARAVRGVVDVLQIPSGVVVLARDTWSAITGRDALTVTWDTSEAEHRSSAEMLADYRKLAAGPGEAVARRGDAERALAGAAQVIEAEFTLPYLAHTPMEPLNAIIELQPDGAEIWAGLQLQTVDATVAAKVLGLTPQQIKINTLIAGGSFGRRILSGTSTMELAEIAKAVGPGTPVHLVWTREDDITGGYYRSLVLHRVRAGLDAAGRIAGWQHALVCQPVAFSLLESHLKPPDGFDVGGTKGLADTPYALADFAVDLHSVNSAVPVLAWRSAAHGHTAFAVETMVDELARRAGKDPLAFRRSLLAHESRELGVLELVAGKAGWGRPLPRGRGRGIAVHRAFDTRAAIVAEVSTGRGSYKVERIVCAVDCGVAINPDAIYSQVEGSIGFALSSVLRNAVTLEGGAAVQSNFDDFEPTRLSEMPRVEVHIVKSLADPTGIGEPAVPPLAPAIGNAIAAATGKRLTALPFDASQIP